MDRETEIHVHIELNSQLYTIRKLTLLAIRKNALYLKEDKSDAQASEAGLRPSLWAVKKCKK